MKQKYNNFILNNIDDEIAIKRLETFLRRHHILVSNNFDEYMNGTKSDKQTIFRVSSMKVCLLIVGLRFAVSAFSRSKIVSALLCDANYLLANQLFLSMAMSICALVILFIGSRIQIHELNHRFPVSELLYQVKHKRLPLNLNEYHYRRFILYANLMTKYLLNSVFWSLVFISNVVLLGSAVFAYFEPNSGFSIIGITFWGVLDFVWMTQFYGIVSGGFIFWSMTTLYLKYKFLEVNEIIRFSLENNDYHLLMSKMREHQFIAKLTFEHNEFFKLMIFILYYFGTPALEILMFLSHEKNTLFLVRFIFIFIFCIVFGAVFTVNLMSAAISRAAQMPSPQLYSFMTRVNLRYDQRFRVMSFIERLSGTGIGFNCYNLFPMNNYEFYQYVSVIACNYILIMNLVRDVSID